MSPRPLASAPASPAIVLTRVDGDARGGAALSMRTITGKPIVLIGTGERIEALGAVSSRTHRRAHPRHGRCRQPGREGGRDGRPATRPKSSPPRWKRAISISTTSPASCARSAGWAGWAACCRCCPGIGKLKKQLDDANIDESIIKRQEAIISSMTKSERRNPKLLNGSRRRRIAGGSGTSVQEINRLLEAVSGHGRHDEEDEEARAARA